MNRKKAKLLEGRIKSLLASDLKYRKSDLDLMTRVWYDDLKAIGYGDVDSFSAIDLLKLLKDSRLTKWDSATRCRRKLQSLYPTLRDSATYKGRKDKEFEMRSTHEFY